MDRDSKVHGTQDLAADPFVLCYPEPRSLRYEPAMRHLIDTYIRADQSEKVSAFDDLSLVQLIVERGPEAVEALPEGIRKKEEAVAETIENNVRKLITDESPINPKYYEKMSKLLDALIKERKKKALNYQAYLAEITELTRRIVKPSDGYPTAIDTAAKKALYDNLDKDERLALAVDAEVRRVKQDDFRSSKTKLRVVRKAIRQHITDEQLADRILEIVKAQRGY
jgi:type I restriction enzyme, R subunit